MYKIITHRGKELAASSRFSNLETRKPAEKCIIVDAAGIAVSSWDGVQWTRTPAAPKHGGRRHGLSDDGASCRLAILLPPDIREWLDGESERSGESRSDIVRRALVLLRDASS